MKKNAINSSTTYCCRVHYLVQFVSEFSSVVLFTIFVMEDVTLVLMSHLVANS